MLSLVSLSNWVSQPILETFPLLNTLLDRRITKLSVKGILCNNRVTVKTFLKSFNKAWKIGKLMNHKTFRCTSIKYHESLIISSLFAVSYQQYVKSYYTTSEHFFWHLNVQFSWQLWKLICNWVSMYVSVFLLKTWWFGTETNHLISEPECKIRSCIW